LESENKQLRRALIRRTASENVQKRFRAAEPERRIHALEKLILKEAASGNW
jgi:hypothetical protein